MRKFPKVLITFTLVLIILGNTSPHTGPTLEPKAAKCKVCTTGLRPLILARLGKKLVCLLKDLEPMGRQTVWRLSRNKEEEVFGKTGMDGYDCQGLVSSGCLANGV